MKLVYALPLFVIFLFIGLLLGRFVLGRRSNRVIQKARLVSLRLFQVGSHWSPELLADYRFVFNRKYYEGKGIVRLDYFLPGSEVHLSDRHGFPVLKTPAGEFAGEEYIETFLLENRNEILVEFDTQLLPFSRLYEHRETVRSAIQNTDIRFPWT